MVARFDRSFPFSRIFQCFKVDQKQYEKTNRFPGLEVPFFNKKYFDKLFISFMAILVSFWLQTHSLILWRRLAVNYKSLLTKHHVQIIDDFEHFWPDHHWHRKQRNSD